MLELVLVLRGRRNGHHVEVERKEEHTVTHPKTIDDPRDGPDGREIINKNENSEDYDQEEIEDEEQEELDRQLLDLRMTIPLPEVLQPDPSPSTGEARVR